ncbi:glutamate--cysteine ligase [Streptomyces sp. NPDC127084]|uniref:carboxylate-amine ligase n=1 Tax=Streptomyces sp. NPDC127084 TaxID=3347133 RepID=UPI003648F0FE
MEQSELNSWAEPLVRTVGVEEEFLLVDRHTRQPVPRASEVLAGAAPLLGDLVQSEFYSCVVETCTRPTVSLTDLSHQLVELRSHLAAAAREEDCLLLGSATPIIPPDRPIPVTQKDRYLRMAAHCRAVVDGVEGPTCGCHVHIGTYDKTEALALSGHLRPWLPALQALSANSPFGGGHDSGFASRRTVEFGRWPSAGPPPLLDRAGYEAALDDLISTGVVLDRRSLYWYARPSEHVPTLEIRVADVNADLHSTVLVAALARGLCAALLTDLRDSRPAPSVPDSRLRAAHRCAARAGVAGFLPDPLTGQLVPAHWLVERLLDRAVPGLAAAGDLPMVLSLLARHFRLGTGADRQRACYHRTGRLRDVVDATARLTTAAM